MAMQQRDPTPNGIYREIHNELQYDSDRLVLWLIIPNTYVIRMFLTRHTK